MVEDDGVLDAALEMAARIARQDPLAVRISKLSLGAIARPMTDAALTIETLGQAILFESPAKRERMTAFLERKKKKGEGKK